MEQARCATGWPQPSPPRGQDVVIVGQPIGVGGAPRSNRQDVEVREPPPRVKAIDDGRGHLKRLSPEATARVIPICNLTNGRCGIMSRL
jgi:hypothetical protein